jgi:hypothetical protein
MVGIRPTILGFDGIYRTNHMIFMTFGFKNGWLMALMGFHLSEKYRMEASVSMV